MGVWSATVLSSEAGLVASLGVQQTRATGHYSLTYRQGGLLTPLCCFSWISINLELWFEELVITGISRSFVSKVILETRNSKKLRHSPLCCTEDISLITFQFEWLLEGGAVLWHRGHDTSKENTWQGTVTHTKKTHDSGPWHIQRKHVTGKPDGAGKRRASAVLSPFELQERWSDRTKSWRAE